MNWHIDWLTVTITGDNVEDHFNTFFNDMFSKLNDTGHGGRFYKVIYTSDLGIQVRSQPIGTDTSRSTIVFPGQACQLMGFYVIKMFIELMEHLYPGKVTINRIDTAFNDVNFTIEQVEKCLIDDNLRSYFKRETIRIFNNPYEFQEIDGKAGTKGEMGTKGITVGGRSSTRYMRIYNKHGYTRLEVEYKAEKAHQVGKQLIHCHDTDHALNVAIGHVRDYVDFLEDWWKEFVIDINRLYAKLPGNVQIMTTEGIKRWFEQQISAAFFVLSSLEGGDYLDSLFEIGQKKYKKSRYRGLLEIGEQVKC